MFNVNKNNSNFQKYIYNEQKTEWDMTIIPGYK